MIRHHIMARSWCSPYTTHNLLHLGGPSSPTGRMSLIVSIYLLKILLLSSNSQTSCFLLSELRFHKFKWIFAEWSPNLLFVLPPSSEASRPPSCSQSIQFNCIQFNFVYIAPKKWNCPKALYRAQGLNPLTASTMATGATVYSSSLPAVH